MRSLLFSASSLSLGKCPWNRVKKSPRFILLHEFLSLFSSHSPFSRFYILSASSDLAASVHVLLSARQKGLRLEREGEKSGGN